MLTGWRILRDACISVRGTTSLRQLVWPPLQLAMPALVSHEYLRFMYVGVASCRLSTFIAVFALSKVYHIKGDIARIAR